VRTSDDEREASVMLVVTANHKSLRAPVRGLLESTDRPDGFFININDRPGPFMVGRETIRIDGRSHVRENMLGTSFLISPTAFFQTNVRAARELLQVVLDGVGEASPVLDLYSGGGLFTVPLARHGAWVVAVEENRQAVKDAAANLRLNQVQPSRVRLVADRAEDAIRRLQQEMFEVVVLDPPRQGCPDAVLDGVCRLEPGRIVYVSCNPARLAVERLRLERGGYLMSRLQAVDMFPHTDHLEAVAVFDPV
jgi:23S rRNA (uracil1939-C5)-methyltransferase